jgi:hypothetical protein
MRTAFSIPALLALITAVVSAQQPLKVGTVNFSEPATIAEVDTDALKGQPSRLAWSPDGVEFYLQTLDGDFGRAGAKTYHYTFNVANGRKKDLDTEPSWASAYWTTKSAQTSPDGAGMKIQLKSETRTANTVSTPMGGALARGGTDPNAGTAAGDGVTAAYNRQNLVVHSMLLNDQVLGEFVNSVIVPGLTFGWGPPGSKVIAYTTVKGGRVVVMDDKGARKEVNDSKDAILPAWSPDATRLAWLQRDGRKKFELRVTRVAAP